MPRGKAIGGERTKQEIMTAALECFTTKGFSETTMSDIHERSGASMGSIYHHFESKERLAAALYLEGLQGIHVEILRVLKRTKNPEKGLRELVRAYIAWFKKHPELGHYLFQGMSAQYLQLEGEKIREENSRLRRDIWEWLQPHIASGAIADLPVELYGPLMLGPTREFLQQWLVRRTPADLSAVSRNLGDAAWKALSAKGGAKH